LFLGYHVAMFRWLLSAVKRRCFNSWSCPEFSRKPSAILGHFDARSQGHYVTSKRRTPITESHSVLCTSVTQSSATPLREPQNSFLAFVLANLQQILEFLHLSLTSCRRNTSPSIFPSPNALTPLANLQHFYICALSFLFDALWLANPILIYAHSFRSATRA
jgi:hypothetical protein